MHYIMKMKFSNILSLLQFENNYTSDKLKKTYVQSMSWMAVLFASNSCEYLQSTWVNSSDLVSVFQW